MATDFQYDEETNLRINERGILDEVDGEANERQQAALRVSNAIGDVPSKPVTRTELEQLKEQITTALSNSAYIDTVLSVSIRSIDDGVVTFDAKTTEQTVTLTVT